MKTININKKYFLMVKHHIRIYITYSPKFPLVKCIMSLRY